MLPLTWKVRPNHSQMSLLTCVRRFPFRVIQQAQNIRVWKVSSSRSSIASEMMKVAVGQMTSINDLNQNYLVCEKLVKDASDQGVSLLSLPECFSFIGAKDGESLVIAEPLSGEIMSKYRQLAKDHNIWLSLGGFQEIGPDKQHIYNTHLIVDKEGEIQAKYQKIHLFDVDVPGGPVLKESNSTAAGSDIVATESPVGKLGLTTCYDLRFPDLYQKLRFNEGAEILLIPSAFTKKTGEAHWEVLLRARAIECQCYVLAAAQAGKHSEKRESYGHAMIVDPWGKTIAKLDDPLETGIAVATIDKSLLESIRQRMPILEHRRTDVYQKRSSL